jgi:glycosyltransferase involved in cell wall biosynthesis
MTTEINSWINCEKIACKKRTQKNTSFPKISIITPSYNQAKFFEDTIRSLLLQEYPNLEIIIIDGGSTDGSVEIIKKYEKWLTHWESKPDKGQTDAIIKGMKLATGDIINWLNSDDLLLPGALFALAKRWESINRKKLCCISGGAFIINEKGLILRESSIAIMKDKILPMAPPLQGGVQASWFLTKDAWDFVGGINPDLNYTMDTDLYYRCNKQGIEFIQLNAPLAAYRQHNETKTLKGWKESIAYKKRFYGKWLAKVPADDKPRYSRKVKAFYYSLYLRSISENDSRALRLKKIFLAIINFPLFWQQPHRFKILMKKIRMNEK